MPDDNSWNIEAIIIPPEQRNRIYNKWIKASIINMEHYKIFKLLNDSTASKFLTKKNWFK